MTRRCAERDCPHVLRWHARCSLHRPDAVRPVDRDTGRASTTPHTPARPHQKETAR